MHGYRWNFGAGRFAITFYFEDATREPATSIDIFSLGPQKKTGRREGVRGKDLFAD